MCVLCSVVCVCRVLLRIDNEGQNWRGTKGEWMVDGELLQASTWVGKTLLDYCPIEDACNGAKPERNKKRTVRRLHMKDDKSFN